MTHQEAFDVAARHLLTQKRHATAGPVSAYGVPDRTECCYRMADGLMCAVGVLIPEDEYDSGFEGCPAEDIAARVPALSGVSVELLEALQEVHDNNAVKLWKGRLQRVAEKWGLDDAVLAEFE